MSPIYLPRDSTRDFGSGFHARKAHSFIHSIDLVGLFNLTFTVFVISGPVVRFLRVSLLSGDNCILDFPSFLHSQAASQHTIINVSTGLSRLLAILSRVSWKQMIKAMEPCIREETLKERAVLIEKLKEIEAQTPEDQIPNLTDNIMPRANELYQSVQDQDKNTGVLKYSLEDARLIEDWVKSQLHYCETVISDREKAEEEKRCREQEYQAKMRQEKENHGIQIAKEKELAERRFMEERQEMQLKFQKQREEDAAIHKEQLQALQKEMETKSESKHQQMQIAFNEQMRKQNEEAENRRLREQKDFEERIQKQQEEASKNMKMAVEKFRQEREEERKKREEDEKRRDEKREKERQEEKKRWEEKMEAVKKKLEEKDSSKKGPRESGNCKLIYTVSAISDNPHYNQASQEVKKNKIISFKTNKGEKNIICSKQFEQIP